MAGQGMIIQFTNKKGQTFTYDHDAVYAKNQERLLTMECFNKYGNYTNSNNLPTWARGEEQEVAV